MTALDLRGWPAVHAQAAGRFNRGEFMGAARLWEEVWQALGANEGPEGPDDDAPPPAEALFLRGLIRMAAGFARWREGRLVPAQRLIQMGRVDLDGLGEVVSELNLDRLRSQLRAFLAALEAVPEGAEEGGAGLGHLVPVIEFS